jgi:SAM-dependent methyltransferase
MSDYDFGYMWAWTHGHLVPFALFGTAALFAAWRGWRRWIVLVPAALALWGLTGFLIVQFVMRANMPMDLPTEAFLRSGSGEVLDVGAGSGRSTVMVLLARPEARVTALDIYSGHFGIDDNTPDRLLSNARAAGAQERTAVVTGDMRDMPLADQRFDAAVSAFAIDHLNREGVDRALAEVARVLRPGGEFLLMVINVDGWVRTAYPLMHHGYFSHSDGAATWREQLERAGFEVVEQGTRPAELYLLARKTPQVGP